MKKIKIIILSVFVLGILAVNLSFVSSRANVSLNLSALKSAFAQIELPPVTITCDRPGSGYCNEPANYRDVWCAGERVPAWDCDPDGDPESYCTPQCGC